MYNLNSLQPELQSPFLASTARSRSLVMTRELPSPITKWIVYTFFFFFGFCYVGSAFSKDPPFYYCVFWILYSTIVFLCHIHLQRDVILRTLKMLLLQLLVLHRLKENEMATSLTSAFPSTRVFTSIVIQLDDSNPRAICF